MLFLRNLIIAIVLLIYAYFKVICILNTSFFGYLTH